jgi:hypothetical protein
VLPAAPSDDVVRATISAAMLRQVSASAWAGVAEGASVTKLNESDNGHLDHREKPMRCTKVPPALPLLPDGIYVGWEAHQRQGRAPAAETARRECRADDYGYFDARGFTDAGRKELLARIKAGFKADQREVMVVSFTAAFCTDGGRRINNRLPGWQDTLPGGAQAFLTFWRDTLEHGGFGFGARILNFPGGALGDVGLFVTWPQNGA